MQGQSIQQENGFGDLLTNPHPKPQISSSDHFLGEMAIPQMLIILKTPGRCQKNSQMPIDQSPTGEHQDFILGEHIKEKFSDFVYDIVSTEKNVYALAANNSCHWSSLQNLCRSLFIDMKEPQVAHEDSPVLRPPGVNETFYESRKYKYALPKGFWPVAIRKDTVDHILINDINNTCLILAEFIEEEAKYGLVAGLFENADIRKTFSVLESELHEQAASFKLMTPITFQNIEVLYIEAQLRNIDIQLEESTLELFQNFYWMFIYAKYSSTPQIQVSLVKPILHLIREKISTLSSNKKENDDDKDVLTLLSIPDRQMAALNSLLYQYSHECFVRHIASGSRKKSTCPGSIYPTSSTMLKIDKIQEVQNIVSFIDGKQYELCRSAISPDCSLPQFLRLLDHRTANISAVACSKRHTVTLDNYGDSFMAKVTLLLFGIFVYYLCCAVRLIMIERKTVDTIAHLYLDGFRQVQSRASEMTGVSDETENNDKNDV